MHGRMTSVNTRSNWKFLFSSSCQANAPFAAEVTAKGNSHSVMLLICFYLSNTDQGVQQLHQNLFISISSGEVRCKHHNKEKTGIFIPRNAALKDAEVPFHEKHHHYRLCCSDFSHQMRMKWHVPLFPLFHEWHAGGKHEARRNKTRRGQETTNIDNKNAGQETTDIDNMRWQWIHQGEMGGNSEKLTSQANSLQLVPTFIFAVPQQSTHYMPCTVIILSQQHSEVAMW